MPRSRWIAIFAAIAALGSLALLTACTPEQQAEGKTLSGINAIRQQNGLPPLVPDAGLVNIARIRSRDMAAKGYFSHTPPDGCNFVCLMDANGVGHAYGGENIAWNTWDWTQTADVAVKMWRNSPPHMENILNCHYQKFGAGVTKAADGKVYYAMIFEGNAAC
ncbi:MAG TPA: CAP domain-containing protein [Dehalococcoidia bacterium]